MPHGQGMKEKPSEVLMADDSDCECSGSIIPCPDSDFEELIRLLLENKDVPIADLDQILLMRLKGIKKHPEWSSSGEEMLREAFENEETQEGTTGEIIKFCFLNKNGCSRACSSFTVEECEKQVFTDING